MRALTKWRPLRSLARRDDLFEDLFREFFATPETGVGPLDPPTGETRKETEEKKKSYYRQEIRYGAFQRSVPLPADVDPAKASAD